MPALVATRFNPDFKDKYSQFISAGKPAKRGSSSPLPLGKIGGGWIGGNLEPEPTNYPPLLRNRGHDFTDGFLYAM